MKIFVNYRRLDEPGFCLLLYEKLESSFGSGSVFMDVEGDIRPGDNFDVVLRETLTQCNLFLLVIGPKWFSLFETKDPNPKDFVWAEIKWALDSNIRIIPVLLNGAEMPKDYEVPKGIQSILRLQAVSLRSNSFNADYQYLYRFIRSFERKTSATTISRLSGLTICLALVLFYFLIMFKVNGNMFLNTDIMDTAILDISTVVDLVSEEAGLEDKVIVDEVDISLEESVDSSVRIVKTAKYVPKKKPDKPSRVKDLLRNSNLEKIRSLMKDPKNIHQALDLTTRTLAQTTEPDIEIELYLLLIDIYIRIDSKKMRHIIDETFGLIDESKLNLSQKKYLEKLRGKI